MVNLPRGSNVLDLVSSYSATALAIAMLFSDDCGRLSDQLRDTALEFFRGILYALLFNGLAVLPFQEEDMFRVSLKGYIRKLIKLIPQLSI